MNIIIRNLLIVIGVFILFAWLQYREDIQNKKKVSSIYERYKKPLLFAAIIGLILNLNLSDCTNIMIEDIKVINIDEPLAQNSDPEMHISLAKF